MKFLPEGLPLDGELWCGRGIENYQYIAGISSWGGIKFSESLEEALKNPDSKKSQKKTLQKYQELDNKWKNVTYQVFDTPIPSLKYESRIEMIKKDIKGPLKLVKFHKIKGEKHLQDLYDKIISLEG